MSEDMLSTDEIRRMAQAIGLDRLTEEHVAQLARAANVAQTRRKALPLTDITPADEPAHVYRLDAGAER